MKSEPRITLKLGIEDGTADPLTVVRGIAEGLRNIDSVLREWVKRAREEGNTWQQIADVLNVTRQSAWERFKDVEQTPDEVIDSVIGSLGDFPGPSADEMQRIAREEDEERTDRDPS